MLMYAIRLAELWSQLHTSIIHRQFQVQLKSLLRMTKLTSVLALFSVSRTLIIHPSWIVELRMDPAAQFLISVSLLKQVKLLLFDFHCYAKLLEANAMQNNGIYILLGTHYKFCMLNLFS
jgi:hypothetical protein